MIDYIAWIAAVNLQTARSKPNLDVILHFVDQILHSDSIWVTTWCRGAPTTSAAASGSASSVTKSDSSSPRIYLHTTRWQTEIIQIGTVTSRIRYPTFFYKDICWTIYWIENSSFKKHFQHWNHVSIYMSFTVHIPLQQTNTTHLERKSKRLNWMELNKRLFVSWFNVGMLCPNQRDGCDE